MSARAHGRPPRAVVLAAGRGSRLGALTRERAKACQPLGGSDLLGRQCALFAERGVHDVTVIVGHDAEGLARRHPRVRTRLNARWADSGSGASLQLAADLLTAGEPVLLSHGDIVYDARMLDALLAAADAGRSVTLLDTGYDVQTGDEVVGWTAADGRLVGVRKGLADVDAAAVGEFVGLSVLQPDVAAAFARAGAERDPGEDYERPRLHEFVRAGGGPLHAVLVSGLPWWNVNYPADLRAARAAFAHEHPARDDDGRGAAP